MKKQFLLKTMMLLCMLMVGMGAWATKYELVTSATQLVAGCKYIIADGTSGSVNVISTESNTNNRRTTTGTVANSAITATDAMMVFKLGGSSNAWTFNTTNYLGTDGDLYNDDTSNNRLKVGNNTETNKFTISFSNNAISSITCNGNTSKGVMCFNGNLVACYASKSSSYKVPQLYKESSEVTTEYNVTISNDIQNGTVSANMTKAEANATVKLTATPDKGYKFDSWNVTNASTSAAITVTNNQFIMPAADVKVSAKFVEKVVNPNEITYDFNDASAYPEGFPKATGTKTSSPVTFTIDGNEIVINAPDAYYIINNTTENRGLFFGKTAADNGKPKAGTAYLGFPAMPGKKLVKVVITATNGIAGSVKMNIYDESWKTYSTELTTVSGTGTKKEYVFNLTGTEANTEYRLASGSSGKNLQFDNIVLTYEKVVPTYASLDELIDANLEEPTVVNVTINDEVAMAMVNPVSGAYMVALKNSDVTLAAPGSDLGWKNGGIVTGTLENVTWNPNEYLLEGETDFWSSLEYDYAGPSYDGTIDFVAAGKDGYYATFCNDEAVTIPYAIEVENDEYVFFSVYSVYAVGNMLELQDLTEGLTYNGQIWLSENEGYLIKAESTSEEYTFTGETAISVGYTNVGYDLYGQDEDNALRPSSEPMSADKKNYKLAYKSGTNQNPATLGFYWGADNGGTFDVRDNSAYLALPKETLAKGFSFVDIEATGIKNVNTIVGTNAMYNLAGQRVNKNAKGIVIVNGKKMLNK